MQVITHAEESLTNEHELYLNLRSFKLGKNDSYRTWQHKQNNKQRKICSANFTNIYLAIFKLEGHSQGKILIVATTVSSNEMHQAPVAAKWNLYAVLQNSKNCVSNEPNGEPTEHCLGLTMSRKVNSILGAIMDGEEAGSCSRKVSWLTAREKTQTPQGLTRVSLRREESWYHSHLR